MQIAPKKPSQGFEPRSTLEKAHIAAFQKNSFASLYFCKVLHANIGPLCASVALKV